MGFKRREGLAGGGITKYADTNFHNCPFCNSSNPYWLTDAYIANYSLVAENCINGYKFQCSHCGGVIEVHGHNDFCFQSGKFLQVKLVSAGRGTLNKDLIDKPISIDKLKQLCLPSESNQESEVEQPEYEMSSPAEPTYQYYQNQPVPIKGKSNRQVLSVISMIGGIVGLVFAYISFLALMLDGISSLFFSLCSLASDLCIAAIVLGAIGLAKERTKKGLPGIICGGIGAFFCIVCLFIYAVSLIDLILYY